LGQEKSISGIVVDSSSMEKLIGANILDEISQQGVITDQQGYFHLMLPKGQTKASLHVSYIGYEKQNLSFKLPKLEILEIKLAPWKGLQEITIMAPKKESLPDMIQLNHITLNALPQLLGENDFLRALQYYPGVLPSDESKNSLYVRGGSPDQNLILVDGIPAFYVYHLGNLSSAFNPDIISDISFSKGGFDARYGGRLSSIIDVTMKEGNKDHFSGDVQIGMLTSRANLQGPINKNKTSFILSARAFYSPVLQLFKSDFTYGFQDYFVKVNHEFAKKSSLSGIVFHTNDLLKAGLLIVDEGEKKSNYIKIGWSNTMYSLIWNYRISSGMNMRAQVYHSGYYYDLGLNVDQKEAKYSMNSTNRAMINGFDLNYSVYRKIKTSFGLQLKQYDFSTGEGAFKDFGIGVAGIDTVFAGFIEKPLEGSLYVSQGTHFTNRLRGTWGTRATLFYNGVKSVSIEPRLNLEYELKKRISLVLSYARMTQPLHLISLNYSDMPTDFWMASNTRYAPEISDQVSTGANIDINGIDRIDIIGYYKCFRNLLYTNQTIPILLGNFSEREGQFFQGIGRSIGLEILWRHDGGSLNGWISSTISKTTRNFSEINEGQPFRFGNDRPLFIATCWIYNLTERINFSAQWFFGSGKPITLPGQKYSLDGTQYVLFDYSELNTYRMKPIHRLDVGANFSTEHKWGTSTWNLSIINVYNRQNPFFYTIEVVKEPNANRYELRANQTSFFPFLPSISYRIMLN
jgi:hypothetical protein